MFLGKRLLQHKAECKHTNQTDIIENCGKIWIFDNHIVINVVFTAQRKTEKACIENQIQNQHQGCNRHDDTTADQAIFDFKLYLSAFYKINAPKGEREMWDVVGKEIIVESVVNNGVENARQHRG